MAEIKIMCPKCKHQLTVQGKPEEKIYVTCPKCNKTHTRRDTTHHQKTKYCKNYLNE